MLLNVIGAGHAGRTLARVLAGTGRCQIGAVLNRSAASAAAAVAFIGAGRAIDALAEAGPAELWLVATADDAIAPAAAALAAAGRLRGGDIVFHASGATPSSVLAPCREAGAATASVHPVKNFSDPDAAAASFAGTWCGCEGEPAALAVLEPLFAAAGGRCLAIDARHKALYHAGGAFACNFLTVLLELALRCEQRAGIPREVALALFEPMVRETVDAMFRRGVAEALAGPIARADSGTVGRHLAAFAAWDPQVEALYRGLGRVAAELAERQGRLTPAQLARIREALG
jgi:predicted short-subunit dehydrogenase-like oxidoreductase (DUF2520 family)